MSHAEQNGRNVRIDLPDADTIPWAQISPGLAVSVDLERFLTKNLQLRSWPYARYQHTERYSNDILRGRTAASRDSISISGDTARDGEVTYLLRLLLVE